MIQRASSPIGLLGCTILGAVLVFSKPADAQQTIFDVPSCDVLEAGHTVGQLDVSYHLSNSTISPSTPATFVVTPRIIRGIGHNAEMGFGVQNIGFVGDHHERLVLALKRSDTIAQNPMYTIAEGLTASSPLNKSDESGLYLYVNGSVRPGGVDSSVRLTLGIFGALGGITGTGAASGGIEAGVQYRLLEDVEMEGEYVMGSTAMGYVSLGAVFEFDQGISVLLAYQRANSRLFGDALRGGVRYQF